MDYKTKAYYRNKIKEIAKRTKISELYIAKKALELARKNSEKIIMNGEDCPKECMGEQCPSAKLVESSNQYLSSVALTENKNIDINKQSHIGYYLISEGIRELYKALQTNKKPKSEKRNVTLYILSIIILSALISGALSLYIYKQTNIILSIIIFILTYIPSTQISTEIIQYILNKISKPKLIPKMDYINGIPEENTTMVIIPGIVKTPNKVKDLISKLEVFYLANKSENIYFTLLGDVSSSKKETEEIDKRIIEQGKKEVERLNKKYPSKRNGKIPIYI